MFFDPAKLHVLDHRGKHFKVRGPLSVKRTPQGRPLLVQAGASEQGMDIAAAQRRRGLFGVRTTSTPARDYYANLKAAWPQHGRRRERPADHARDHACSSGRTEAEARDKYDLLNALVDRQKSGLSYLYGQMGDLSDHDLDGPVPEPRQPRWCAASPGACWRWPGATNLTIRQLYTTIAAGFGGRVLVGTPEQIVDDMEAVGGSGGGRWLQHLPAGAAAAASTSSSSW